MSKQLVTTKIWKQTRKTLRMISALTGKPMTEIVDRLAAAELKRLEEADAEAEDDTTRNINTNEKW